MKINAQAETALILRRTGTKRQRFPATVARGPGSIKTGAQNFLQQEQVWGYSRAFRNQ
jgi:hypothetical protein